MRCSLLHLVRNEEDQRDRVIILGVATLLAGLSHILLLQREVFLVQDLSFVVYEDPEGLLPPRPPIVPVKFGGDCQSYFENGPGNRLQSHIEVQIGQRLRELFDLVHLDWCDDPIYALVVSVKNIVAINTMLFKIDNRHFVDIAVVDDFGVGVRQLSDRTFSGELSQNVLIRQHSFLQ